MQPTSTRKVLYAALAAVLLLSALLSPLTVLAPAQAQAPGGILTSNGIWLQAGVPLPVFKFSTPEVTGDGSVLVASLFSAIGRSVQTGQDQYNGHERFTIINETTDSVLERFGATGGFYAYNAAEAFGETPRGAVDPVIAQQLACNFLVQNQLLPDQTSDLIGTPPTILCDYDFNQNPYPVSLITSAAADANGDLISEHVIGALVQVPMFVKTSRWSQIAQIPLGGPGGHLSFIFRTTDFNNPGFTLEEGFPGLGALAMPFYSRSLTPVGTFPALDPAAVKSQVLNAVRAGYPEGTDITVPDPSLLYWVSDAAAPQTIMEPMLEFEGVQVVVDGNPVILRSFVVPALEGGPGGFGPTVVITGPADGSEFTTGDNLSLAGSIGAGTAPYGYRWLLEDGTVLNSGALTAAGNVSANATLPTGLRDGSASTFTVILEAEDSVGALRQASITLSVVDPPAPPQPAQYLPLLLRNAPGLGGSTIPDMVAAGLEAMAIYRFGVHAGSDYPPYGAGGSDLPGVVPDANGFRTGMSSYGWTMGYNWWNANAWEKDWRDTSLGGIDQFVVDSVDFAYYAGHSGRGGLSLPSSKDSSWFDGADARYSNLRWAAFASCQALRVQGYDSGSEPIRRWFGAFRGAHMLLGYNSNMKDVAFGPRFVDNMRAPTFFGISFPSLQRSIRSAWVQTVFQMDAGKPAYLYAKGTNGVNPADNKLPRSGDPAMPRPFPVQSYHWVWWNE